MLLRVFLVTLLLLIISAVFREVDIVLVRGSMAGFLPEPMALWPPWVTATFLELVLL